MYWLNLRIKNVGATVRPYTTLDDVHINNVVLDVAKKHKAIGNQQVSFAIIQNGNVIGCHNYYVNIPDDYGESQAVS